MLSIIMEYGREYQWHTGEKLPIPRERIMEVAEVQMDGDELIHIVKTCLISLNTSDVSKMKPVLCLVGDFARQAIANL